jgi:[ribosomal protein S18]-alanine N-acetyltransferase
VKIRPIQEHDVESVLAIQTNCREAAQWTSSDYARAARGEMVGWVAEHGSVIGFLIARRVGDDVEILNLAVNPNIRRAGVGTALLREALDWGEKVHAHKAFLEVRAGNAVARQFYDRHGFRPTGRRPHYYTAPADDALLLTLGLGRDNAP